jgi:hypothetical protein
VGAPRSDARGVGRAPAKKWGHSGECNEGVLRLVPSRAGRRRVVPRSSPARSTRGLPWCSPSP